MERSISPQLHKSCNWVKFSQTIDKILCCDLCMHATTHGQPDNSMLPALFYARDIKKANVMHDPTAMHIRQIQCRNIIDNLCAEMGIHRKCAEHIEKHK